MTRMPDRRSVRPWTISFLHIPMCPALALPIPAAAAHTLYSIILTYTHVSGLAYPSRSSAQSCTVSFVLGHIPVPALPISCFMATNVRSNACKLPIDILYIIFHIILYNNFYIIFYITALSFCSHLLNRIYSWNCELRGCCTN